MAKTTYIVEHNGKTHTRKSDRSYTHAIVQGDNPVSYCGSEKLARAKVGQYSGGIIVPVKIMATKERV